MEAWQDGSRWVTTVGAVVRVFRGFLDSLIPSVDNDAEGTSTYVLALVPMILAVVVISTAAVFQAGDRLGPRSVMIGGRPYSLMGHLIDRNRPLELCVSTTTESGGGRSLITGATEAHRELEAVAGVSLPLTIRSGACASEASHDGTSVITWADLNDAAGKAIAYGGSHASEADVSIDPDFTDCLVPILAHELGHVLGLAHQRATDKSVMGVCTHPTERDGAAMRILYGDPHGGGR